MLGLNKSTGDVHEAERVPNLLQTSEETAPHSVDGQGGGAEGRSTCGVGPTLTMTRASREHRAMTATLSQNPRGSTRNSRPEVARLQKLETYDFWVTASSA